LSLSLCCHRRRHRRVVFIITSSSSSSPVVDVIVQSCAAVVASSSSSSSSLSYHLCRRRRRRSSVSSSNCVLLSSPCRRRRHCLIVPVVVVAVVVFLLILFLRSHFASSHQSLLHDGICHPRIHARPRMGGRQQRLDQLVCRRVHDAARSATSYLLHPPCAGVARGAPVLQPPAPRREGQDVEELRHRVDDTPHISPRLLSGGGAMKGLGDARSPKKMDHDKCRAAERVAHEDESEMYI
jgi:hypothetical protein